MDHAEMNKAFLNALNINEIVVDIDKAINNPSEYSSRETTLLFSRCKMAIESLRRNSQNENASEG